MLAWHLGLRYLRTRRAAWLALAAITLTVAVPVIVIGVMEGFVEVTEKQVRANESDLTCEASYYQYGVADGAKQRADLAAVPGVRGVAPFITAYAMMTPKQTGTRVDDRHSVPCQVDAIEWSTDSAIGRLAAGTLHPTPAVDLHHPPLPAEERGSGFLTPDWRDHLALTGMGMVCGVGLVPPAPRQAPTPGLVIARELALNNGLVCGNRVQLLVPNGSGGATGKINAEISDTFGTGVYEVDKLVVMLPLPLGQVLNDMGARTNKNGPLVSGYRLWATQPDRLVPLCEAVAKASGLRTTTWEARRGNLVESQRIQRNIGIVVMVCIQIIAVFVVYAVFSTLVSEKRHDLGVLLGIGARRSQIAGAFLVASLVACTIGGALGWGIGWGVLAVLNPVTTYFKWPLFPQDVMYTPDAPISWNPLIPLLFASVMGTIGLVAASLPAWRAGRIDPVEILREGGG